MKTLFTVLILLVTGNAHAYLSRSATQSMQLQLNGMYTTSDPTCMTGLVATLPVSATARMIDFAANPNLGSGPVAAPVKCLVFIVQNTFFQSWAPGNYSGSTSPGMCVGNNCSDATCGAGGSSPASGPNAEICGHGSRDTYAMTWPAQIAADMAAAGLATDSTCTLATKTIPLFISVNSACTGNGAADQGDSVCMTANYTTNINPTSPPAAAGDHKLGFKLASTVDAASKYVFYVNTDNTTGGCSPCDMFCPTYDPTIVVSSFNPQCNPSPTANSCGNQGAPVFGFRAARAGE